MGDKENTGDDMILLLLFVCCSFVGVHIILFNYIRWTRGKSQIGFNFLKFPVEKINLGCQKEKCRWFGYGNSCLLPEVFKGIYPHICCENV